MNNMLEEASQIDIKAASNELITWLVSNVENYIDNDKRVFKIDIVIASDEMPQLKKLQDLYYAVPDDIDKEHQLSKEELNKLLEECVIYRNTLNEITKNIHIEANNSWAIKELFTRMAFYFEKVIPDPNSYKMALKIDADLKILVNKHSAAFGEEKAQLQKEIDTKLKEGVSILKYDKLEGDVRIESFEYEAFEVGVRLNGVNSGNDYVIPEGFSCTLALAFNSNKCQTSLF